MISNAKKLEDFARQKMKGKSFWRESFWVFPVDSRLEVLGSFCVGLGSSSSAPVSISSAFKLIFRSPKCGTMVGMFIAHNHPSGSLAVSDSDVKTTRAFANACRTMELTLFDHVIVTEDNYTSIKDECPLAFTEAT